MKVLTFSRHFPKDHPKAWQPTYFVEKVLNCFRENFQLPDSFKPWIDNYAALLKGEDYLKAVAIRDLKHHTIRAGYRYKPGDMVSLRVWSGLPYRSKQIEFAQVEVKKVWEFNIHFVGEELLWQIPCTGSGEFTTLSNGLAIIAGNDGLDIRDFIDWFTIHPKYKGDVFTGQIICWDQSINY